MPPKGGSTPFYERAVKKCNTKNKIWQSQVRGTWPNSCLPAPVRTAVIHDRYNAKQKPNQQALPEVYSLHHPPFSLPYSSSLMQ